MAVYTYDEEADALYILVDRDPDVAIERTVALGDTLHVDVDREGRPVGVEILYPTEGGVDLEPVRERFGLEIRLPFRFAA